jgi:hypothetical protein
MNRYFAILMCGVCALVSCDKAKSFAAKVMKQGLATKTANRTPPPVDEGLQKWVDQTADGVVFRKDLPFPARLDVRTTRCLEISGRFSQSSAIEVRTDLPPGTHSQITQCGRSGDQVFYQLEQSAFVPRVSTAEGTAQPAAKPADKPSAKSSPQPSAKPLESPSPSPAPPPSRSVTFRKTGTSWVGEPRTDFRAVALAKDASPVFDQLLIENALAPRPLWFAKRRFKIGDQLVVNGTSLPMLLVGDAQGSFTLKLEAFEPVEGHPCGVFSVTGNYHRKQSPDFEGLRTDEDVTIQSGKLWLSLIYPVILKEELDTIQTLKSGGQGGLVTRGQGAIQVSVTRAWKPLLP